MATTSQPADVLRRMFDDSMTMLDPWMSAWAGATTPTRSRSRQDEHGHGCQHCCDHGTPDADLVLVARVGERRIVPLSLHNAWRRERPVTIQVSAFRSCDPCAPDVPIEVTTHPRGEIVLPPCSRTVVDVIVALPDGKRDDGKTADLKRDDGKVAEVTRREESHCCSDAHCCSVTLIGDISTDGCARPVRLAVVVLPRDCDAHEIDCCGCCSC